MAYPVYYVVEGDTLPIMFDTFDGGTGASVTMTGIAVTDIEIYKDGSVTQRASDAGYTLLDTDGIDFDGITGIHGFSIDTSDNTTAGFYEVGPWYHVVVSSVTVDAQTVNFIAAAFRIVSATRGMAGTALPAAAADAAGGLPISDAGGLDLDTKLANTNEVTAARMGALTDWINGGRLDLLLDLVLADTGELQADWANGGRLDLILDARAAQTTADAILTDTAEIGAAGAGLTALATQTSVNTVDTVVDAIKAQTDKLTFTVANQVDANIQSINDVALTGDGSATPFNV